MYRLELGVLAGPMYRLELSALAGPMYRLELGALAGQVRILHSELIVGIQRSQANLEMG